MAKENLLEEIAPSLLNTFINLGTFLLIAIFLSSKAGIDVYGEYAALVSLIGIFYILSDFGINHFFPKIVSRERSNKQKLSLYFSYFLTIRSIAFIFFSICIFLFSEMSLSFNFILSFYLFTRILNPEIFFKSLERNLFLLYTNIFSKLFLIISFFSYDFSSYQIEFIFLMLAISNLIICFVLFYDLIFRVKLFFTNTKEGNLLIFELFKYYFSRLAFNAYHQGSTFFVSLVLPYEAVGIYSIVIESSKAGQSLVGVFSTALYVRISRTRDFNILIKTSIYFFLVLFFMFIPFVTYGFSLLDILFDFNVEIIYKLFLLLYIFTPVFVVNALWGYPFFSPINREDVINRIIFISSIIYFLSFLTAQLLPDFNIFIAVGCILLADLFGFILRIYFVFIERHNLANKIKYN